MDPSAKAVYLTFDDGPIPEATPFVLDTLAHYGIKATFFVVGDNVHKYPELFQRIINEGHRIGNHTYNHIGGFRWLSKNYLRNTKKAMELMIDELRKMSADKNQQEASINQQFATPLFRPPHGWMRPLQYRVIRNKGYKIIMWDLVTRDYSKRLTAAEVLENVKHYARNGSIITFHDSLRSINKLKEILPLALEWLIAQGYEFRVFD